MRANRSGVYATFSLDAVGLLGDTRSHRLQGRTEMLADARGSYSLRLRLRCFRTTGLLCDRRLTRSKQLLTYLARKRCPMYFHRTTYRRAEIMAPSLSTLVHHCEPRSILGPYIVKVLPEHCAPHRCVHCSLWLSNSQVEIELMISSSRTCAVTPRSEI